MASTIVSSPTSPVTERLAGLPGRCDQSTTFLFGSASITATLAPRLDRTQAQILAVETEKVERHECSLRAAAFGHERPEVAASVIAQHHRLAVDERPVHIETANHLGDRRESSGEVRAAAAPDVSALAQLAGKDPEAVVLHLVQPTGSGGRAMSERGLTRPDEADWQISSPARCRGAPGSPSAPPSLIR
jgi:hypothetical protein